MRRIVPLVLLLAAAAVPSASGGSEDGIAIRPGVGIGPINLGMTWQHARRILGKPRAVSRRAVLRGRPYIEFEWNYGDWWVGLVGRKGNRRVVLVGTALTRHRTAEGLGVGTTEARLWRELRGRIRERSCSNPSGLPRYHWYVRRNALSETIFLREYRRADETVIVGRVQVRSGPALGCNLI